MTSYKKHTFTFSERWAVFRSYKQACIYCQNVVEWRDFEVDHILNESLLKDPMTLSDLIKDYGLKSDFEINSYHNWACSHHSCNRTKSDTTFDKSRALHYLLIAEKKTGKAADIFKATVKAHSVNKVLAPLRALIENGTLSHQEIVDFAHAIIKNAEVGLNNPTIICFGLNMEDVYENLPRNAPNSPPQIYDWLESELTKELQKQLKCSLKLWEDERNGETISARYAFWDLDFNKIDSLKLQWWEILELALHTEIYGEFVQNSN